MSRTLQHIYNDENINIYFEVIQGSLFIHMDVYKITPKLVAKWRLMFEEMKDEMLAQGVTEVFTWTPNTKFCKIIDPTCKVIEKKRVNHRDYEVLVWDLTP